MGDAPLYLAKRSELGVVESEVLAWRTEPEVVDHETQRRITRDSHRTAADRRCLALLETRGRVVRELAHNQAHGCHLARELARLDRRLDRAAPD